MSCEGHALRVDGHSSVPHVDTLEATECTYCEPNSGGLLIHDSVRGRTASASHSGVVIIGVAGASGSGKTSIAELIAARLSHVSVLAISSDNYYISLTAADDPTNHNFDHPSSIDFPLLGEHLAALRRGEDVEVPHYDFRTHKRTADVTKISGKTTDVIIIDGIFALWAEQVRKNCDMTIFCSEDLDVCLARRLARDIEKRGRTPTSVIEQYLRFVKPGYHEFIAPSMTHADLIVPRARDNVVAITMLAKEIQRRVNLARGPISPLHKHESK